MSKTRCKFICDEISTQNCGNEGVAYSALFVPVTTGCPENESFFKWTPNGKIELTTLKDQLFKPGKEYYIDISLAE